MANRCSDGDRAARARVATVAPLRGAGVRAIAGALALAVVLGPSGLAQDRSRALQRAGDRIRALLREADGLAAQQSKLLVELKTLDDDRQAKVAELQRVERELDETQVRLTESTARAAALQQRAESQRPDVEARLVRLYMQGRAGYWRMLLDVEDLRAFGRAYRAAAALTAIDRERLVAHQETLQELQAEQKTLQARAAELTDLKARAARARMAADRAVDAHTALVDSIDARRDLNAQMVGELQAAQQRLQASLAEAESNGPAETVLPLEAFRGALPWPARGRLTARYGRDTNSRFGTAVVRNGIEIASGEGQPVSAVHEGTVAYADQFTGYGTLVIIEHGGGAFTLYGYLSSARVERGQRVDAGTPVGVSGRSPAGNPAVYFELRIDGRPVDPLQWLQKGNS